MADLVLPIAILDELVELAQAAAPRECCGLISTHNGVAAKVYPATNIAQRDDRYEIAGSELYDLEMQIACDWPDRLRVFYHSHVFAEAIPSQPDIIMARNHPNDLHLIISLLQPEGHVTTSAYWIDSTGVRNAKLRHSPSLAPTRPAPLFP